MPIYKNYSKDYFKKWSSDMAYILGFMYADGNIVKTKRGTHFVAIYSADAAILNSMKSSFQSEHVVSRRSVTSGIVYRIQIGSKEWFTDLTAIGLTPDKTKRMVLPNIPQQYFGDFVRGYFDGDGNVWVGLIHKNRPNPSVSVQVSFTSASFLYLESLYRGLKTKGVEGGSIYVSKAKNFARLSFSKRDALILYEIMYNTPHKLYLDRKKSVFEQFMENCGGKQSFPQPHSDKI